MCSELGQRPRVFDFTPKVFDFTLKAFNVTLNVVKGLSRLAPPQKAF